MTLTGNGIVRRKTDDRTLPGRDVYYKLEITPPDLLGGVRRHSLVVDFEPEIAQMYLIENALCELQLEGGQQYIDFRVTSSNPVRVRATGGLRPID